MISKLTMETASNGFIFTVLEPMPDSEFGQLHTVFYVAETLERARQVFLEIMDGQFPEAKYAPTKTD